MHGYKTQQNWNDEKERTWSPPSPDVEGVRTGGRWWRSTTTWAGTLKPLRGRPVSLTRYGVVLGWPSCSSAAESLESWSWFPIPRNPAILLNSPMNQRGYREKAWCLLQRAKIPLHCTRLLALCSCSRCTKDEIPWDTIYTQPNQSFTFTFYTLCIPPSSFSFFIILFFS